MAGDSCILDPDQARGLNRPMGSVWLSLRADFRLRWRPLAALALLLGLIGGVVLTAAAGERRTDEQIRQFAAEYFTIFDFHVIKPAEFHFQSLTLRRPP